MSRKCSIIRFGRFGKIVHIVWLWKFTKLASYRLHDTWKASHTQHVPCFPDVVTRYLPSATSRLLIEKASLVYAKQSVILIQLLAYASLDELEDGVPLRCADQFANGLICGSSLLVREIRTRERSLPSHMVELRPNARFGRSSQQLRCDCDIHIVSQA